MAKTKNKIKFKEKIALALFMESVPLLIDLWKRNEPSKTFDEFCIAQYEIGKQSQKRKSKKEVTS